MRNPTPYLARSRASRHEVHRDALSPRALPARELPRLLRGSQQSHEARVEAVLRWLGLHRIPALELYTGPRIRPRAGGGFDVRANRSNVGISDVLACLGPIGRLLLIEVKTGKARRTPEQLEQQRRFEAAGALCLVVRDVGRDMAPIQQALAAGERSYREALTRLEHSLSTLESELGPGGRGAVDGDLIEEGPSR